MYDLAVKEGFIYQKGRFKKNNLYVKEGIIEAIGPEDYSAKKVLNVKGAKVIPGIIDPHVHFNLNTGTYTSADNFESGSRTGLFAGVTSFIDFLDPVSRGSDVTAAFKKRKDLSLKSLSDYSFHVTAANPVGQTSAIAEQAMRLKLPSIKIFTAYSESGRRTYDREIEEFLELSEKWGFTLMVHGEDEDYFNLSEEDQVRDLPRSRPVVSEISMLNKLASYVRKRGGFLYMVHTTCGESVRILSTEFRDIWNKKMFLESCPQYFYFNQDSFKSDMGYRYVLAPPLRPGEQQQELIKLSDNIYSIGTDHCPFLSKEKNKTLLKDIPFGIGGIQYSFPLMHHLLGDSVIDKMTLNPAKRFGLYPQKGVLQEQSHGDFFIYKEEKDLKTEQNQSRCDYSLYENLPLRGRVETTVIRGEIRMDKGVVYPGKGLFLPREVS